MSPIFSRSLRSSGVKSPLPFARGSFSDTEMMALPRLCVSAPSSCEPRCASTLTNGTETRQGFHDKGSSDNDEGGNVFRNGDRYCCATSTPLILPSPSSPRPRQLNEQSPSRKPCHQCVLPSVPLKSRPDPDTPSLYGVLLQTYTSETRVTVRHGPPKPSNN
jgi:hypothetical protein